MRDFIWWAIGIPLITGGLIVLALLVPSLALTWVLFGAAGLFGPAAGFIGIYLDRRRYRRILRDAGA